MKELILGYSPWGTGQFSPFDQVFDKAVNVRREGLKNIDALVLWGGEDIHPSFYNRYPHPKNQANHSPSERDIFEYKAMLYCKLNNIPIIGVCRGAQFACAFAGGRLVQHCDNHEGVGHTMITNTGELIHTNSYHHQMMYPFDVDHELLAWSKQRRSTVYQDQEEVQMPEMADKVEPEVVFFPRIRALAVQGHPEWLNEDHRMVRWLNELVVDKLLAPSEALV